MTGLKGFIEELVIEKIPTYIRRTAQAQVRRGVYLDLEGRRIIGEFLETYWPLIINLYPEMDNLRGRMRWERLVNHWVCRGYD